MTPADVLPIRAALGLDHFAFAAILGVHASSIYRWESASSRVVRAKKRSVPGIQRLQSDLLDGLARVLKANPEIGPDLGKRITKALLAGGSLAGLRVVLDAITKENPRVF